MDKMTETARKLLGDRKPHMLWGDVGLGDDERTLSHKRALEFIKAYPVTSVSIDHNNYGEFQFISLRVIRFCNDGSKREDCMQLWGNGYHDYRDVMLVRWEINMGNSFIVKGKRAMPKREVMRLVSERRQAMGIPDNAKQETSGNTFEFLADLTDEDGAYTELYQ